MKLAIVTHNVIKGDGQGRANYEITRRALEQGHSVTLVADHIDTALVDLGAKWIPIQPRILRKVNLFKVYEFAKRADTLLEKGLAREMDVIHGYGHTLSVPHHINTSQFVHAAWKRSPFHSAKQDKNLYGAYQWTYSTMNSKWEKVSFGQAKRVVAASHTVYQELQDIGVTRDRMSVVLNGVDLSEFHPADPKPDRASLGLPGGDTPLAVFVGDIRSPRKNLESVLQALVNVPNLHLAVAGRVEGSPYPKMAADLGIADRVFFLDFRRDVAQILRACDFFVFPSRYEACALVILEAIASGLPVITATTTGGSEVLTPECGILLSESDDVPGLTRAMAELAGDPERRQRMSKAAWDRAQLYTWNNIADQYLDLYREVAA
ncbi:MAG: glycosyltransferase family 4 protein [Cytophagales bacterium]|nr:glycosyltransferase family 4 protein [Armatimonadota bacterium]